LERLHTLLKQIVLPRPLQGILTDYLTPAELAADLHIKEDRLSEWKREGFGPPRTRIKQRVAYRREAVLAHNELVRAPKRNAGSAIHHARDQHYRTLTPATDFRGEVSRHLNGREK